MDRIKVNQKPARATCSAERDATRIDDSVTSNKNRPLPQRGSRRRLEADSWPNAAACPRRPIKTDARFEELCGRMQIELQSDCSAEAEAPAEVQLGAAELCAERTAVDFHGRRRAECCARSN